MRKKTMLSICAALRSGTYQQDHKFHFDSDYDPKEPTCVGGVVLDLYHKELGDFDDEAFKKWIGFTFEQASDFADWTTNLNKFATFPEIADMIENMYGK